MSRITQNNSSERRDHEPKENGTQTQTGSSQRDHRAGSGQVPRCRCGTSPVLLLDVPIMEWAQQPWAVPGSKGTWAQTSSTHLHQLQLPAVHMARGWVRWLQKHDAHLVALGR